jgi:ankyrin repeat protein
METFPGLSSLSVSKCFGVEGNQLFQHLYTLKPEPLKCLMLQDLPLVHLTPAIPTLSGLLSLGLTNCNLEALSSSMGTSQQVGGSFIEKLAAAVTTESGALPELKFLFLGGSVLSDVAPAVVDNNNNEAPLLLEIDPSIDCDLSRYPSLPRRRLPLQILEVTFLSPVVVARLTQLFRLVVEEKKSEEGNLSETSTSPTATTATNTTTTTTTQIIRLDTSPVASLAAAFTSTNQRAASNAVTEARDAQKASPLLLAARSGDDERVEWLLGMGARVGLRDVFGATALYRAAEKGHASSRHASAPACSTKAGDVEVEEVCGGVCEQLLAAGADPVKEVNHRGESPLFIAALKGHTAALACLLAIATSNAATNAAAPTAGNNNNNAVSGVAAATGPRVVAAQHKKEGDDESRPHGNDGSKKKMTLNPEAPAWVPLSSSSSFSSSPFPLQAVLSHSSGCSGGSSACTEDADDLTASTSDADGFSPLHSAVIRRSVETLEILLAATLQRSSSPRGVARIEGDATTRRWAFNVNACNKHGQTPLHLAARQSQHHSSHHMQSQHSSGPHQPWSVAAAAAQQEKKEGHKDAASLSAATGPSPSDSSSSTCSSGGSGGGGGSSSDASVSDACRVVELLLRRGSLVNALDDTGKTPLDYALAVKLRRNPSSSTPSSATSHLQEESEVALLLRKHGGVSQCSASSSPHTKSRGSNTKRRQRSSNSKF